MLDLILKQYKTLLDEVSSRFDDALKTIPEIPCRPHCIECCKQLFPLSLVEAFYINEGFRLLPRAQRRSLESLAKKEQKKLEKMIDFKTFEIFNTDLETLAEKRNSLAQNMQLSNNDCPLLTKEKLCLLYPYRNHDCRIHGASYSDNEILGCLRHKRIFTSPESIKKLKAHAVPSNFMYKEKNQLDSILTTHLANNPDLKNVIYATSPYIPFLKDFTKINWNEFFDKKCEKHQNQENNPNNRSLIIDTEYAF